ncbi:hypothetical protein [Hymenobacter terrenus]|uniref:hypothetical protein n=1 Tax=Hymenobacter terrenus TaxID=1629124 RepID=UPI00061953E1|nr:hypothetical protein [Hymenobacter terrenus]
MIQDQKNHRKMYGNVLTWFGHAGAPLLGIKLLARIVGQVTEDVAELDVQAARQIAPTTGVTRTRTAVKIEAAEKAEVLRGLTLVLTTDSKVTAALAKPVSSYLRGQDAAFGTYCQAIVDGIDAFSKQELEDAGYQPAVRDTLQADLLSLTATSGEAALMQASSKTATDSLIPLFAAVDAQLTRLDQLVQAQRFTQAELVTQYEALRRLPKTPTGHRFQAKGLTPYDVPQLAFNILEESVPTPTLYNTGGRGHEVVFYLGATATSRPLPGQGVLVKNGKKVTLSDYSSLGDAATAPFLLVMQTSQLAAGGWRVRG